MTESTRTPAQDIAAGLVTDGVFGDMKQGRTWADGRAADIDVVATAAAHIREGWGHYGYSLAVEYATFDWTLFRGHHSDGSDFWFVVDRYCNVADLPRD